MRTLIARNFDGMADFDGVKPIRNKRVIGEAHQIGWLLGLDAMHGPPRCRSD
jgi:hypothetical protein